MKNENGHHKKDDFIAPARRAFRRVARQLMPGLACRLSWEKKAMCALFAPDKESVPGKLVLNRTITLNDTWAKEAQKA